MPLPHNNLRILFAWPGLSGFYGPCWRFLQEERGVKLKCICANSPAVDSSRPYNAENFLHGIDVSFPPLDNSFDAGKIREDIQAFAPDVMFITGWSVPVNRFLATDSAFRGIRKVFCFDMPWQVSLRKIAARFVLGHYLRNFDAAFVPGLSTARYARWLGFGGKRPVITGSLPVNSLDLRAKSLESAECGVRSAELSGLEEYDKKGRAARPFAAAEMEQQNSALRPHHSFLYVGRYSYEKGVDILAEAYRMYSARVDNPWCLDFVGAGAQSECIKGIPGVSDLGFRQPSDLPEIYLSHSAFILPSRSESWGVAMAEAAACGLPVICTDACGGRFDLVRETGELKNGFVVPADSASSLADAMLRMHHLTSEEYSVMSVNSGKLAAPYSLANWSERVLRIVEDGRVMG